METPLVEAHLPPAMWTRLVVNQSVLREALRPGGVGRTRMVMANGKNSAVQMAIEAVSQAKRRRDEQARIVSEMVGPPSEVAFAKRVLAEIDQTLEMARVYQRILEGMAD